MEPHKLALFESKVRVGSGHEPVTEPYYSESVKPICSSSGRIRLLSQLRARYRLWMT